MYSEKTPDDGQRNCPKHVEFYSKNKFEKSVHLVGIIIRIVYDCIIYFLYNILTPIPRVLPAPEGQESLPYLNTIIKITKCFPD